jgi:hypothetical protein
VTSEIDNAYAGSPEWWLGECSEARLNVLTVRVEVAAPLRGTVAVGGLREHVGVDVDDGWTEQVKFTLSANPFTDIRVMPATPEFPAVIVPREVG